MATKSSIPAAGKTQGSNGGNHGRFGLRAKVAASVLVLACAVALILGGLWVGAAVRPAAQMPPPASTFVADQFTFREDHRAATAPAFVPDQFTFREDHRER